MEVDSNLQQCSLVRWSSLDVCFSTLQFALQLGSSTQLKRYRLFMSTARGDWPLLDVDMTTCVVL
jgi:hypothetical protein